MTVRAVGATVARRLRTTPSRVRADLSVRLAAYRGLGEDLDRLRSRPPARSTGPELTDPRDIAGVEEWGSARR
jgi:hypothetical protein